MHAYAKRIYQLNFFLFTILLIPIYHILKTTFGNFRITVNLYITY